MFKLIPTVGGKQVMLAANVALRTYEVAGQLMQVRAIRVIGDYHRLSKLLVEIVNAEWWTWQPGAAQPFADIITRGVLIDGLPLRLTLVRDAGSVPWIVSRLDDHISLTLYSNWRRP